MNGHERQPPDKLNSDDFGDHNNESILCKMEIKQEPIVKEEPEKEDDGVIWTVSRSSHTFNGVALDILTGDKKVDVIDDFVGDLIGGKSEVKVEKDKETANPTPKNSHAKDKTSRYNAGNGFLMGKKQKPIGSNGVGNKRSSNAAKKQKAKIFGGKNNSSIQEANQKRHKCSLCDYVTENKSNLKTHTFKHTGEKSFPCTVCSKRFTQKHLLQAHMKKHVDEFFFSCSICLQGFNDNEEKMKHEAVCSVRRYECHLCKEFSTLIKTDLEKHMRVHTGERPFECDYCPKKFTQANHLKKHRKTHTNPRPLKFKCSVCFKNFPQQTEKEKHAANCKRRGHKCNLCNSYTTHYKTHLEYHMRIHTGEKPFQCEICSKCFSQKTALNTHKKIHKCRY